MSDWELTPYKPSSPNKKMKQSSQSDWSLSNPPQDESFLKKLPRNVVSGLAESGHGLLNTPHDLAKYLEQSGKQFGDMVDKAMPLEKYGVKRQQSNFSLADHIPYQEEKNFAQMLGQKGEPTFADTVIQKGAQYAPDALLAANALKGIVPHLTRRGASKKLRKAHQLGIDRNMNPLNVNPQLIEDMRQFLPKTEPYRNAIDAAHTGDYQKLFELQSDAGKESAALAKNWFSAAERSHGKAGLKSVNALLDDMHKEIQAQGHLDISDLMREGRNDYRRYSKFKPYKYALGTAATAYAIPKNALTNLIQKLALHYNK